MAVLALGTCGGARARTYDSRESHSPPPPHPSLRCQILPLLPLSACDVVSGGKEVKGGDPSKVIMYYLQYKIYKSSSSFPLRRMPFAPHYCNGPAVFSSVHKALRPCHKPVKVHLLEWVGRVGEMLQARASFAPSLPPSLCKAGSFFFGSL